MIFIIMIIIATTFAVPVIFLIWAAIHELSHYIVAKKYLNITNVSFFLYPHNDEKLGFVWAKVKWKADRAPTEYEMAHICFAPRIPDFIAVFMFLLWPLMPTNTLMLIWAAFWIGGLIDLFVGSLGIGQYTDLRRVSNGWDIEPWIFRALGMSAIFCSLIGSLLIYLAV